MGLFLTKTALFLSPFPWDFVPLSPTRSTLRMLYESALAQGDLRPDVAQSEAISVMENFAVEIEGVSDAAPGFFSRLGWTRTGNQLPHSGLYLYGDVGRGKSMLMDLFFAASKVEKKRRVHFHQFMLEIHQRLHEMQSVADVLPHVAKSIAAETQLLCFDEFHVSNIADAMILGRLFEALFDAGVIIVSTSNWRPDALYQNGLQRDRFLPFIELIKQKMVVHCLNGDVDHRYEKLRSLQNYFHPLGEDATRKLQGIFLQLTDEAQPETIILPVQGRTLKIVHAAKGVGFFNFEELCTEALGAADYLEIAKCLHTVILDNVPKLTADRRNETLRFITLIDALYEAKVKFFMAAEERPERLGPGGEHNFAFQRTLSRLMEMQSEEYRQMRHVG